MNHRTALALLVLPLAGCKKREPVHVPPPGLTHSQAAPTSAPSPVAPEASAAARPRAPEPTVYDFERQGIATDPGALESPDAGAHGGSAEPEPTAPRDLAPDLERLLREAADGCVDMPKAAAQPGGRLTLSVSAYVLATGSFSSAQVTAPGQPESALRCLQQAVLRANVGDVRDAPRRVQGAAQLEIKQVGPTAGADAGAKPAFPLNPNTARPALPSDLAKPAQPVDLAEPEPPDFAGPP
jgi:hypothetical protein